MEDFCELVSGKLSSVAVYRFFLPTIKTLEGICLALAEKFLQKELRIIFVFKIILLKRIIKFSFKLIYEQLN